MKTLYILSGFNNYYNRMVKLPGDTTEDYPEPIYILDATNFVPNDGVNTEHVVGTYDYDGTGDYLLVVDAPNNIMQRWFIIDSVRNRQGQYTLTLRRDLVADYYNIIAQSPMFIEKASLPYDNPLIFNNEDMTFNQIKTEETLLKDKSGCAWLVGYYDRNKISELNGSVPTNEILPGAIAIQEDIENWSYYKYSNLAGKSKVNFLGIPYYLEYGIRTIGILGDGKKSSASYFYINAKDGSIGYTYEGWETEPSLQSKVAEVNTIRTKLNASVKANNDAYLKALNQYGPSYAPITSTTAFNDFNKFQGATIRDARGDYYEINISTNPDKHIQFYSVSAGSMYNQMSTIVSEVDNITGTPNNKSFFIKLQCSTYSMEIVKVEALSTKYSFAEGIIKTIDSPWNVFCLPYITDTSLTIKDVVKGTQLTLTNSSVSINTAMAMQKDHPGIIYDMQLLPYCPIPGLITNKGEITLYDSREYSQITHREGEDETVVGYILHVASSKFSSDLLDYKVNKGTTSVERKVNNECDKWRLTSPNYSNYFDFSVEKNDGIQYFNIDCNYKPFTPYIHINPNFSGLYGYDDNSPRGLVLGGDFSLSQIIDSWEQYQIQNKNFQNIFDRQIQNMEVNNKYQRLSDQVSGIAGTLSGITSGAFAGGVMSGGGTGGTVAGGIIGGIASGIGGIADYKIKEKLRNEALDYTKDLFGYQLGNIQALPNTIGKVSAFNRNNKIFPILEYYTCTNAEKEAFINKLAWNGMTVMAIGTINDLLGYNWVYQEDDVIIEDKGYIKGQLIRFDTVVGEDFHIVNEIASELNKGVYIK